MTVDDKKIRGAERSTFDVVASTVEKEVTVISLTCLKMDSPEFGEVTLEGNDLEGVTIHSKWDENIQIIVKKGETEWELRFDRGSQVIVKHREDGEVNIFLADRTYTKTGISITGA